LALSPDGSQLVFVGDDGQSRKLYMRTLSDREPREILGTEGAASPFFSPDGAWIGFFVDSRLVKVSSISGAPVAVQTTTGVQVNRGATWVTEQKVVIAGSPNSGLSLFSVDTQDLQPMSAMTQLTDRMAPHSWPIALPDGSGLIFNDSSDTNLGAPSLQVLTMDTREIERLNGVGSNPRFSSTGHLLYARGGALYAMGFDERQRVTTGGEFEVLHGIITDGNGSAQYAVGGRGTLAYVAGSSDLGGYELVWLDREGGEQVILQSDLPLRLPRLSPDGSQVAVTIVDGSNVDLWLLDPVRRSLDRRLTSHPGEDFGAVWHPGGQQLTLSSEVDEESGAKGPALAWIPEIGQPPVGLTSTPGFGNWEFPASWSPDGQWIAYVATRDGPSGDILLLSPDNPDEPTVLLQTPALELAPMFSPDGRWIAYVSDDTGSPEVYVQPFPGPGDRRRISARGGAEPRWSRDGREIFYREGRLLMAVPVDGSGERFEASEPQTLFETESGDLTGIGAAAANYDVSLDGSRFLIIRRQNAIAATVIDVVLNWPETLGSS
jgi:serine/threonine-protein kinase